MPAEAATAIVVRGSDWSETSRIVTLWTREFGKLRALAKGGRRLRSQFEMAFDLLTVCRVMVIRKHSGGLDLLTEAQCQEQFPLLRTNMRSLYSGYYLAELLADGTQDYDPHPILFDFGLESLRLLNACTTETTPELLFEHVSAFELVWLQELGYSPLLDACALCQRVITRFTPLPGRVFYSLDAGGVVCPECAPLARDCRPLSVHAWQALRTLARSDSTGSPIGWQTAVRIEVRSLLGQLVSAVLGRRPRLLGYLEGG